MLMEDEAGFYRQPTMARLFGPVGRRQPRALWGPQSNRCLRAAAAFDPIGGRLIHRLRSSFPVREMSLFYRFISHSLPEAETIFLVMDNWPNHHHPVSWRGIEADPRIRVLWLPTYAPWLNPTEKIWKWVRQKLTHMHPFSNDMGTLRSMLDETLAKINDIPEDILRYTGTGKCKLYCS